MPRFLLLELIKTVLVAQVALIFLALMFSVLILKESAGGVDVREQRGYW